MEKNIFLGASAKCSAMSKKADCKPWSYLQPTALKGQAQESSADWYLDPQRADR